MQEGKTALILGASGLVGSSLLPLLLDSENYSRVVAFVRSELSVSHPKLTVHQINFDQPILYRELVEGDDLFCCLGTTIGQAGSKEAFRRVDYEYPVNFAKIGKDNGVQQYLLISSIGADAHSSVFYLRTKGECEDAIRRQGIPSVSVFRPASLSGERKESRWGEKISLSLLKAFSFALKGKLAKYRPIEAQKVARVMYEIAQNPKAGFTVYESETMQTL